MSFLELEAFSLQSLLQSFKSFYFPCSFPSVTLSLTLAACMVLVSVTVFTIIVPYSELLGTALCIKYIAFAQSMLMLSKV